MTATNHALTGAAIGLIVAEPLLAVPLALASHFALDVIPHYGRTRDFIRTDRFRSFLIIDAALCLLLVVILVVLHPRHWLLAAVCAFVATSPDFMWVGKFLRARRGQKVRSDKNSLLHFHGVIQWFQRPIGMVVEATWAFAAIDVLARLIR